MDKYSPIVLLKLQELLPLSVFSEMVCFTFYDEHPRDTRTIDITVCCKRGVVQEFHKRELIDSILIENVPKIEEIELVRNAYRNMFYLVAAKHEIIILSKKEKLQIHKRITGVQSYAFNDIECIGQPTLKIVLQDDAYPVFFNENFDGPRESPPFTSKPRSNASLGVVKQLMRKLTEVEYSAQTNDTALKGCLKLRQEAAFKIYQNTEIDSENSVAKLDPNQIADTLLVTIKPLKVTCCNKKIIIMSSLHNRNKVPITDVAVLLHNTNKQSLTYTTKVFNAIPASPYWEEVNSEINVDATSTVVAVVDLKEIGNSTMKSINFDAAVSFKREEETELLPLGAVKISPVDFTGDRFDVLSDEEEEKCILMLALISTSKRVNLCLRHIKHPDEDLVTLSEIFCTYLKMESLDIEDVVIHKKSPHHILYGVLVVFEERTNAVMNIRVYARSHWQVLALINYMYDAVPHKIIATTPEYKLTGITKDHIEYKETSEVTDETQLSSETVKKCALSLLKQIKILKEYFALCTRAMLDSQNERQREKALFNIDLFATGLDKYLEFRNQVLEESYNCVKLITLNKKPVQRDSSVFTYGE